MNNGSTPKTPQPQKCFFWRYLYFSQLRILRNDSIIKLHFLLVILYFHSVKKPRQCPALPRFFALLKNKIPAYKSELY